MKIDEIVAFSCIAIIFNSLDVFSLLAAIRDRWDMTLGSPNP